MKNNHKSNKFKFKGGKYFLNQFNLLLWIKTFQSLSLNMVSKIHLALNLNPQIFLVS